MFQAPFLISLLCELINISTFTILYFKSPLWSSNTYSETSLRNFALVLLIFSVFRFTILLPLAWIYSKDKRIRNSIFFYIWLLLNIVVIITVTSILSSSLETHSTKKWRNLEIVMSILSFVSIFCQVLCIRHLRSSVLPERHVVLDFTHGYINLINSPPSPTLVSNSLGIYPVVSYTDLQPPEVSSATEKAAPKLLSSKQNSPYASLTKQSKAEFISDMKKKFHSARSKWNEKVDRLNDLLMTMNANVQNMTQDVLRQAAVATSLENSPTSHVNHNKSSLDEIFEYILNLFTTSHTNMSLPSHNSVSEENPPVEGLSEGEVLASELEVLYAKSPYDIEFFIPQLAVFLLYGSFDISIYLQSSILRLCERSYVFSHKLYWFIRSFSLTEAGVTEQGVFALKRLLTSIEVHSSVSSGTHDTLTNGHNPNFDINIIEYNHVHNHHKQQQNKLKYSEIIDSNEMKIDDDIDSPYSPLLELPLSLPNLSTDSNNHNISSLTQHNIDSDTLHNELAATQKLYYYQQQYGCRPSSLRSSSAFSLYSGREAKLDLLSTPYEGLFQPLLTENYSTYEIPKQITESNKGLIKQTREPMVTHSESSNIVAPSSSSTLPSSSLSMSMQQNRLQSSIRDISQDPVSSYHGGTVNACNLFQKNIVFWDQLTDISRHIGPIPPVKRLEALHILLKQLQVQYFVEGVKKSSIGEKPAYFQSVAAAGDTDNSPVLYIPLANTQHKIISIVIDECFAFSTKERAPLFLCFEILDTISSSTASKDIHKSLSLRHVSDSSSEDDDLNDGGQTIRSPRSNDIYIDKIVPFWTNPITLPPFMSDILTAIRGNDSSAYSNECLDEQDESDYPAIQSRASTTPSSPTRTYPRISKYVDSSASSYNKVVRSAFDIDASDEHVTPMLPYNNTLSDKSSNLKHLQSDSQARRSKDVATSSDSLSMNIIATSDLHFSDFALYDHDEVKIDLHGYDAAATSSFPSPPPASISQSSSAANLGQWGLRDTWQAVNDTISNANHDLSLSRNEKEIFSLLPLTVSSALLPQDINSTANPSAAHVDRARLTGAVSPHADYGSTLPLHSFTPTTALSVSPQTHFPHSSASSEDKADNIVTLSVKDGVTQTEEQMNENQNKKIVSAADTASQSSSSIVIFKEAWKVKEERYKALSPSGHLPGWRLMSVIVKSGDDLRQEQCAAQLISLMHKMLKKHATCEFWLKPYDILALSPDCGLIEAVPDTVSLDVLRKRGHRHYKSLSDFFIKYFGLRHTDSFLIAQHRFMVSLATYCIVSYILSIKDRHNGNILLDIMGHIIHIDFGYILAKSPGGNFGFEKAPFKLTREMVNVMGGVDSRCFHRFRELCVSIFLTLRRHHNRIILLLEMLAKGNEHLDCFGGDSNKVIEDMRQRFFPDLHDNATRERVHTLIDQSLDSWTTTCYDRYQRCCVGIF